MAFDREAAKADGYTDEEIDQYLATKDQPLPPDRPIDRSEEQMGTAQAVGTGMATAVAPYALAAPAAYGGYRMYNAAKQGAEAAKALADAKMASEQGIAQRALAKANVGMPVQTPVSAPVVPTAPPAPTMAPAPAQPSVMQRGTELAAKMREIAAQKVMPAMGQAGQMAGRGLAAVANSPITRVGGMAMNAAYSGGLNTNEEEELRRRRAMAPTITR